MKSDIIDLGINFGFEDKKFYVDYTSCGWPVSNYRDEFKKRAIELSSRSKKLMLGLSSGLDSQAVLHSFYEQNIKIECAFLYQPGFNEIEFSQLKILEKKYNINTIIVEINPYSIKEEIIDLYHKTGITPNQQIHKKFLEKLPEDYDFIQGVHGPDLFYKDSKWFCLETANSFEISRLRAFQFIKRSGKILGWERTGAILLSLLTDDILTSFMNSYNYISNNKLVYKDGSSIPIIDYWDLYIKPFIYGKYWKKELEYFPKFQGCENIDFIMEGPRNNYKKHSTIISYDNLVFHLKKNSGLVKRVYEKSL